MKKLLFLSLLSLLLLSCNKETELPVPLTSDETSISEKSFKSESSCQSKVKNAKKFLTGDNGNYWSMKYYNVDSVTGETLGFVILPPIFPPVLDTITGNTGFFEPFVDTNTNNLTEWIGADTSVAPFNQGIFQITDECDPRGVKVTIQTQFPIQNNELFIEHISASQFSILFYIPVGANGSVVPVRIIGRRYGLPN